MLPEATSEKSAGAPVVTADFVSAEAQAFIPGDDVTEPMREVGAQLNSTDRGRSSAARDLFDLDPPPHSVTPEVKSSAGVTSSRGPEDKQRAAGAARSNSRAGRSVTRKPRGKGNHKDQPIDA